MKILAELQEMAASEILANIPAARYLEIKARDSKPEFRAYVIGEEGYSTGPLSGIGSAVKRWAGQTIRRLVDKLQEGLPLFLNHNADNSHGGRVQVGQAVGKFLRKVNDKLQAVMIGYILPEHRGVKLDAASIEADVEVEKNADGTYDVDVLQVTGVALGDRERFRPGFPAAGLIAQLQEFENQFDKKEMVMEKDELRRAIKTAGYTISDLFEPGDWKQDRTIIDHIERSFREEYGRRLKAEEKLSMLEAQHNEQIENLKSEKAALAGKLVKVQVNEVSDGLLKSRVEKKALAAPVVKYIKKELGSFRPENLDEKEKLQAEIEGFIDGKIDEFNDLFGDLLKPAEAEKTADNANGNGKDDQAGSGLGARPSFRL